MLKKTITYEDLNGNEVTEDFYFNLSMTEIMEEDLKNEGGFEAYLKNIIASKDGKTIVSEFKKIILMTYGVKSEDGKRFVKDERLRYDFANSLAFEKLFFELCTDENAGAEFINGIIPKDLAATVEKLKAQQGKQELVELPQPETRRKFEDFTEEELLNMSQEDFQALVPSNPKDMTREQLSIAFQRKNK